MLFKEDKEFPRKCFIYNLSDESLSSEIKQELEKLGARTYLFGENENSRALRFCDLWNSDNPTVKALFLEEIKKHNISMLKLAEIKTYWDNLQKRMDKIRANRKNN